MMPWTLEEFREWMWEARQFADAAPAAEWQAAYQAHLLPKIHEALERAR